MISPSRSRISTQLRIWAGAVVAAASVVALASATSASASAKGAAGTLIGGPPGPEGVPLELGALLAPAPTSSSGKTIDGVGCDAHEQVAYHVHTHLAVYVNGSLRPIPAGIGLAQPAVAEETQDGPFYGATNCYYWLHVHAQDGVIHIESPTNRTYTLGQFFAVWRQPLGSTQVGSVKGKLTVWVNGTRYSGNPAGVRLGSHEDVQIDVGTPLVSPKTINWSGTGL